MQTQSQSRKQTPKQSIPFETRVQQLLLKHAQAPEGYHSLLRLVYGNGYDRKFAEALRLKILKGDHSWMPPVRFVDHKTLREARGAYDKGNGVIFLADDLRENSWVTAATFLEELGHHLGALLQTSDTPGDEGELFRRLVLGEHLSSEELARVRQEDDSGSILVDNKKIEVEFWGIPKFVKKVGGSIVTGVKTGAGAVADVAEAGAGVVADVAEAGAGTVADVVEAGAGAVADVGNKLAEVAASAAEDVWDGT
jgi:hypothetical protein